jgi:hypothetical protein
VVAVVLVAIILISVFAALNWSSPPAEVPEFYVGVEVAYTNANVSDMRAMVDRVKDFTNLLVIGSIELTFNETALNETCDYIYSAGMKIVVLFTNVSMYSYDTQAWLAQAQQKYGNQLLGLYRYDEPGGDQLDNPKLRFVSNATSCAEAAELYTQSVRGHVDFYVGNVSRIFTADYGLYWWDYKSNYTALFAEFVGNQSRQRHVALCRGAASAHGKDFGAIITWKYDNAPYLENGTELYNDLTLAYAVGAKYIIVFDYPKIGPYGTLTDDHFDALQKFWNYSHQNPQVFGSTKADVAYVAPADYGFGFRSATDTIWGLFPADQYSKKIWNDVETLIIRYDTRLDILFDDPDAATVKGNYGKLFFWNETVT